MKLLLLTLPFIISACGYYPAYWQKRQPSSIPQPSQARQVYNKDQDREKETETNREREGRQTERERERDRGEDEEMSEEEMEREIRVATRDRSKEIGIVYRDREDQIRPLKLEIFRLREEAESFKYAGNVDRAADMGAKIADLRIRISEIAGEASDKVSEINGRYSDILEPVQVAPLQQF